MLNITRRRGEKTIITVPPSSEPTRIVIDVIRPAFVKIGIKAPREVAVDREEVHLSKQSGPRPSRRYTLADAIRAQEAALRRVQR